MSWSYSQALVGEFSAQCFSDTGLSALLSTTHMPDQFYWPDKTTEHSRLSRFGMTCERLTAIRGEALLTWFLEDFLAKTSALPETGPDWTARGQGYGQKWQGLLAKYSPDTHSLKTAQLSLLADSTESCLTLPRWGLMLDGELYPQPTPALCTEESESGYWPTPQTRGFTNEGDLMALARKANSYKEMSAMAYRASHKKKSQYWPTPCASASASKGSSQASLVRKDGKDRSSDRLDHAVMASDSGQLNPDWVEWLMGWPIGQTALKPLATGRFQEFELQHGVSFMETNEAA